MFNNWFNGNRTNRSSTFTQYNKVNTSNEKIINELFEFASKGFTSTVIDRIDEKQIDINSKYCVDSYNNTLLHIAVLNENMELIRNLLIRDIDKDKKNQFGQTPLDIAIQMNNKEIVKRLFDNTENYNLMKTQLNDFQLINNELTCDYNKIVDDNKFLTIENDDLKIKLKEEVKCRKRLRDENNVIKKQNKKLKTDNAILEKTVRTLRNSNKK